MTSQGVTDEAASNSGSDERPAGPSFLAKFHRHLHGRYIFACSAGLILAVVAAGFGYVSQKLSYKSTGTLRITPLTLKILYAQTDVGGSVFEGFVDVQINSMKSRPVMMAVLDNPEWQKLHPAPMPLEVFSRNLEITHQPRSELIEIAFTDSTPAGAQAGVHLLIESYMKLSGDQSANQRVQITEERSKQLQQELDGLNRRIAEIAQNFGTDNLKQLRESRVQELGKLETMIMDTQINLAISESAMGKSDAFEKLPASEIASTDEIMRRLFEEAQRSEEKLAEVMLTRGKDHPDVVAVRTKLKSVRDEIKARAEAYHKFHKSSFVTNGGAIEGVPTAASIQSLKERRNKLRELYDAALPKSVELGKKASELAGLQEEAKKTRERLTENQTKAEQLRVDSSIVGQIMVINTGELPNEPVKDRRRTMAGAGGFAGFLAGFALVAALTFTDRSLRRADDLAASGVTAPLLGTFPKLDQASVPEAAYALHEVVTGLQIDPELSKIRVLAVSSATAGQGKSEMAAALAVGFAALGKRTLLIDFDHRKLVLTQTLVPINFTRAYAATARGLCDVLAGTKLEDCVIETKVDGVWFLPMRGKDPGRIGSLTSVQVRELFVRAANEFEVVIIDTPPILDGLESTLICKEAESLLLAATPKTNDRELRRAVRRVRGVGAMVGGVLFNLAKKSDFPKAPKEFPEQLHLFLPGKNASFIAALKSREPAFSPSTTTE
ncbi:exopolysaccharide regulatory tyrosine autokinase VpsO [soil metagenome]